MQVWILIRQLPARGLSPNHEGVHGSLDVRLVLAGAVHSHRHGHQGPVVALQHLGHRVPDAHGELFYLLVLFEVCEMAALAVRSRSGRGVLGHARAGRVGETLVLLGAHLQAGVEQIHAEERVLRTL